MKRIIGHWTAGTHKASTLDAEHYHWLIEDDGRLVAGKFPEIANSPDRLMDGTYAAHTLHCNSGSVGIAVCGMLGATLTPLNYGRYPIKQAQWNAFVAHIAKRAMAWKIPVTRETILTHAEVQANLGLMQKGKWDIAVLPFDPKTVGYQQVGDRLRKEVAAIIAGAATATPAPKPATDTPIVSKPSVEPQKSIAALPKRSLWDWFMSRTLI